MRGSTGFKQDVTEPRIHVALDVIQLPAEAVHPDDHGLGVMVWSIPTGVPNRGPDDTVSCLLDQRTDPVELDPEAPKALRAGHSQGVAAASSGPAESRNDMTDELGKALDVVKHGLLGDRVAANLRQQWQGSIHGPSWATPRRRAPAPCTATRKMQSRAGTSDGQVHPDTPT